MLLKNTMLKILTITLIFGLSTHILASNVVSVQQDDNGWKLIVDGKDTYIKGVVWGYTPKGENYTYNLWGKSDKLIRDVLDYDFSRMQKAGVNAIRSFASIPPKWITYVYEKYDIMTVINPLMGRYGMSVDGTWVANTDYSDLRVREILIQELVNAVETYKDTPGVLMFALGNESNYGLSWKSFEIENLPEGEQHRAKAEHLYSLFAEAIAAGKRLDQNHPFTIVNGDIQYIDLIAKYGKDWDLLGVNSYRGISFTSMWADTKNKLDKPIALFEFGSDAFNAKDFVEDEASQAHYLKGQWHEMYAKAHGQGAEGNSLGGFVFQWRDEWWKYQQDKNLDIHDTNASWSNGGYQQDFEPGHNNMNEEWWGINRLGDANSDGVYTSEPRLAYDVLAKVWQVDPYAVIMSSIDDTLNALDSVITNGKQKYSETLQSKGFGLSVGKTRLRLDGLTSKLSDSASNGDEGLMAFIDMSLRPNRYFNADFTINAIDKATQSDFEFKYGDREHDDGLTNGGDKIELYSFKSQLKGTDLDILGFYHVPRYHWGDEGDFFGLLRETTDMDGGTGQDIWNAKAPYGVEIVGKNYLNGLKIVAGPEVYWGANPKVIAKYQFGNNKQYTLVHSHDVDIADDSSGASNSDTSKSQQTTLYGEFSLDDSTSLEIGGIVSNIDKIDDVFFHYDNGTIMRDSIDFKDTLGLKAKLNFKTASNVKTYASLQYAGLVADGGDAFQDRTTALPRSFKGNQKSLEFGVDVSHKNYTISPKIFYRDNLVEANPNIESTINTVTNVISPGLRPRTEALDPFAVLGNRAARAAELYFTYDPTPGTYFYEWDNDTREDAAFAYNLGLTVIDYQSVTDSYTYHNKEENKDYPFFDNMKEETVWVAKSKMVFNPNPSLKAVIKLEAAKQQPDGMPPGNTTNYWSIDNKFIINDQNIITTLYQKDKWGKYDFQKDFGEIYPYHYEIGYTRLLDKGKSEKESSKAGIRFLKRGLDARSNNSFYQDGAHSSMFEVQTFIEYIF